MYDGDELLVHTGDLAMQSALGFYSNGSFASGKRQDDDAFTEYVKKTETGKLLIRAGMLESVHPDDEAHDGFPPGKTEDKG